MVKKNTNKKTKKKTAAVKKIKPVTEQPAGQQPAGQQPAGQQPAVNAEFEAACQVVVPTEKQEKRGGFREGAGRPLGLTDEKAKVKNLPQYPSGPIRQGSQALFDLWAAAAKIEELALTDDEADLFSLPITQLADYYFPGMIPEIAGSWVMLIFAVTRIVKPRIKMVNEVRKMRRAAVETKTEPAKESRLIHYKTKDDKPLHALAPGVEVLFAADFDKVTCQVCKNIINNLSIN